MEIRKAVAELGEKIGEGNFGRVHSAFCDIRGRKQQKVAVKIFNEFDVHLQQSFLDQLHRFSLQLYHPNIINIYGGSAEGKFEIVSEFIPENLNTFLCNRKEISRFSILNIAFDVVCALTWLEGSGIVHGDVKLENIFIQYDHAKITDFGFHEMKRLSKKYQESEKEYWRSPEYNSQSLSTSSSDVYSFGILLWEMITKPFEKSDEEIAKEILQRNFPQNLPQKLKNLIENCLQESPNQRPSLTYITNEINELLFEIAIPDPIARSLWISHFTLHSRSVPFLEFIEKYTQENEKGDQSIDKIKEFDYDNLSQYSYSQLEDYLQNKNYNQNIADELQKRKNKINILQHLFCKKGRGNDWEEERVKIENFGIMINFFGPVVDRSPINFHHLFEPIFILCSQPWFAGDIGINEAENRLCIRPIGTFLVRFSSISPYFTISKQLDEKRVHHQRIFRKNGEFLVNDKSFPDLITTINEIAKESSLLYPCPGSQLFYLLNFTNNRRFD